MEEKLLTLKETTLAKIKDCATSADLDTIKTKVLGKKGDLTDILKSVAQLSKEEKPVIGKLANIIKQDLLSTITSKQEQLEKDALEAELKNDTTDTSLPASLQCGHAHPINQTIDFISTIFNRLGYSVKRGPEVENDHYNFEALNIPAHHPARDMHDTFYVSGAHVMRTHTSPVQIRTMEKEKPPLKIIVPGKVYRYDADTSHSPVFHQIEGLYVSENVTFSELKGTLSTFLKECFGENVDIRFRPSYFPFTEPSVEVDIKIRDKNSPLAGKWLEILGAGMVHRNVFRSVGYNPDEVTGFAFGLGVERIAMLRHHISDIRLFYENDLRFLHQF